MTDPRAADADAVAIIGMAGRFPGAGSVDELWAALTSGRDQLTREHDDRGKLVRAGGVVADLEGFDRALFSMSSREADLLDPQHRMFLEASWNALEDAGYRPRDTGVRTGLFGGVGVSSYLANNVIPAAIQRTDRTFVDSTADLQLLLASDKDYLTSRVAYLLDLTGPVVSVQAACATGLYAVHLAAQSLLNGECDLALAGAASASVPQLSRHSSEPGMVLSGDGHCRTFDAAADGTVFSSGCGVVVLKLLADALRDGDDVRAVLRGSAIGNDGADKVGLTAPSAAGQARVLSEALSVSGLAPEEVDYVEAHGTGTAVGDPIEVDGLVRVHGARSPAAPLLLGSVKPTIGHLGTAAGIASLIKTVLMLEHRRLLGVLGFTDLNPEIDLSSGRLQVLAADADWPPPARGGPRRAGVSSFGLGGYNAHVVLDEAPATEVAPAATESGGRRDWAPKESSGSGSWLLLPLSAASAPALRARARGLQDTSVPMSDVAYTLAAARQPLRHRATLAVRGHADAQTALMSVADGRRGTVAVPRPRVAFIFTGFSPGADWHLDELLTHPAVTDLRRQTDPLLQHRYGQDLTALLHPETGLARRFPLAVGQPVQFVLQCAMAALWQRWGLTPTAVLGHSLGEFAAAQAAGVMDVETGLRMVAERGRLLQDLAGDGAMAALALPQDAVDELLGELGPGLSIAVRNGAEAFVVAGPGPLVDEAVAWTERAGGQARPLGFGTAGHSAYVDPVVAPFRDAVADVRLAAPTVPMVSAMTGRLADHSLATVDHWARHLRQPVEFAAAIQAIDGLGPTAYLEIGPGPVLSGLVTAALSPREVVAVPSLRKGVSGTEQLARAAAALVDHGVDLDLVPRSGGRHRRLPGYEFDRARHWVEPPAPAEPDAPAVLRVSWPAVTEDVRRPKLPGCWVVAADAADSAAAAVRDALRHCGADVAEIDLGACSDVAATVDAFARARAEVALPLSGLLWFAPVHESVGEQASTGAQLDDGLERVLAPVAGLARSLGAGDDPPVRSWWFTRGAFGVREGERGVPVDAMVPGFLRSLAREDPDLRTFRVDLDPQGMSRDVVDGVLDALTRDDEADVAYRSGRRHVRRLVLDDAPTGPSPDLDPAGQYLVTGGGGGLGLITARHLLAAGAGRVVLVGRTGGGRWTAAALQAEFGDAAARVEYRVCDVARPAEVTSLVTELDQPSAPLRGVVHAAVELHDATVPRIDWADVQAVMGAKARGAAALIDRLAECRGVQFLTLFSSATGVVGNVGQAAYGAASAYLDALVAERRDVALVVQSIAWGPWRDAGHLAAEPRTAEALERNGMGSMSAAQGRELLARLLGRRAGALAPLTNDWRRWNASGAPAEGRVAVELPRPALGVDATGGADRSGATQPEAAPATPEPVELAGQPREEAVSTAKHWTGLVAAEVLGGTVAADASLADLGLDSLSAVQLRNGLTARFGFPLRVDVCLRLDSVSALAGHLVDLAEQGAR